MIKHISKNLLLTAALVLPAVSLAGEDSTPPTVRKRMCEFALKTTDKVLQKATDVSMALAMASMRLNIKMFEAQMRAFDKLPPRVADAYLKFLEGVQEVNIRMSAFHHKTSMLPPSPLSNKVFGFIEAVATTFRGPKARREHNKWAVLWQHHFSSRKNGQSIFDLDAQTSDSFSSLYDKFNGGEDQSEVWEYQLDSSTLLFALGKRLPRLYRAGSIIHFERGLVKSVTPRIKATAGSKAD